MARRTTIALGIVGSLVAAAGAWTLYQRLSTETVPNEVVAHVGDVELRRYPPAVLAETTADSQREAFGRLFRYITGANEGDERLEMTTPVEVSGGGPAEGTTVRELVRTTGRKIPMTAPVETSISDGDGEVRMAFYLPAVYDDESAPRPTDDEVDIVTVPERTLGVSRFSGYPTDERVAREREQLLEALERADISVSGDPFFHGYDAPWTIPWLRRNEVAVEVNSGDLG